ncbi:MAG: sulfur reduction protein DsrJ [Gammaproteobacteria bacterium]|nr:sulfur reduction protein DsrJ [Gammaproteobacteria bacterium]
MTRFLRLSLILTGLIMLFPSQGMAETPFPIIHEPEGKECVEDEDDMRRNHMNYIRHQRDKTMREGIRAESEGSYSLSKCIDCHVEANDKGVTPTHNDKEHFCVACHEYAAVQIDCFQCHADRPQKNIKRSSSDQALKDQLQEMLAAKDMGDVQ